MNSSFNVQVKEMMFKIYNSESITNAVLFLQ